MLIYCLINGCECTCYCVVLIMVHDIVVYVQNEIMVYCFACNTRFIVCGFNLYLISSSELLLLGSVYKGGWMACPNEWRSESLAEDFEVFKEIRAQSLKLIEAARSENLVTASLEADVYIQTNHQEIKDLINNHFSLQAGANGYSLADFLIVSEASVTSDNIADNMYLNQPHEICYKGVTYPISVGVVKAKGSKCPRCWSYRSLVEDSLCERCQLVMK